jgi:signal transduction histidine kinase
LLILTVRDDGVGFDSTGETAQSGLGLSSMRERAQLAGGSFNLRSQPGKGTTVSVTVPFDGVVK